MSNKTALESARSQFCDSWTRYRGRLLFCVRVWRSKRLLIRAERLTLLAGCLAKLSDRVSVEARRCVAKSISVSPIAP